MRDFIIVASSVAVGIIVAELITYLIVTVMWRRFVRWSDGSKET